MRQEKITPLTNFLKAHSVMCLATCGPEGPHATSVFYAFEEDPLRLIFLSDPETRHMREIAHDPRVSVGIHLETEEVAKIQGVQAWGRAQIPRNDSVFSKIYFERFPPARLFYGLHPGHRFCIVTAEKIRLIDNRFGFGKKKEWMLGDNNTWKII